MKPIIERDEKGHLTHYRGSDGDEFWLDAAGNITHVRFGDGTDRWYNAAGHVTKWTDENGTLHTN